MGGTPCRRDSSICHPTANCPSGKSSPPGNPCFIPMIGMAVLVGIPPSSADGHYPGGQEPMEKHKPCWLWLGWQSNSQKAAAHLEHLMRGHIRNKWKLLFLICKNGSALQHSDTSQAGQKLRNLEICVVKFLEMMLEAQVFLTSETDRESCRLWRYHTTAIPAGREKADPCWTERPGRFFPWSFVEPTGTWECLSPSCPGTDIASLLQPLHLQGHKHLPLCQPSPRMRSCWFLVNAACWACSPLSGTAQKLCSSTTHTQFPMKCTKWSSPSHKSASQAMLSPQHSLEQETAELLSGSSPDLLQSSSHKHVVSCIWIELELESSKPWAAPGNSTSSLGICSDVFQQLHSPERRWVIVNPDENTS